MLSIRYNGQVELLRKRLLPDVPKLEIRSVDGFQVSQHAYHTLDSSATVLIDMISCKRVVSGRRSYSV